MGRRKTKLKSAEVRQFPCPSCGVPAGEFCHLVGMPHYSMYKSHGPRIGAAEKVLMPKIRFIVFSQAYLGGPASVLDKEFVTLKDLLLELLYGDDAAAYKQDYNQHTEQALLNQFNQLDGEQQARSIIYDATNKTVITGIQQVDSVKEASHDTNQNS